MKKIQSLTKWNFSVGITAKRWTKICLTLRLVSARMLLPLLSNSGCQNKLKTLEQGKPFIQRWIQSTGHIWPIWSLLRWHSWQNRAKSQSQNIFVNFIYMYDRGIFINMKKVRPFNFYQCPFAGNLIENMFLPPWLFYVKYIMISLNQCNSTKDWFCCNFPIRRTLLISQELAQQTKAGPYLCCTVLGLLDMRVGFTCWGLRSHAKLQNTDTAKSYWNYK